MLGSGAIFSCSEKEEKAEHNFCGDFMLKDGKFFFFLKKKDYLI